MILSKNVERCNFVALSTIVADVCGEFSLDEYIVYEMISNQAPWIWGDTNRSLIRANEFVHFLDELLVDANVSEFGVDTYCVSLRDFLNTQNAYVDLSN
jgi:hypothetical protein